MPSPAIEAAVGVEHAREERSRALHPVVRRAPRYDEIPDGDLNDLAVLIERRRSHLDQSLIRM
jgi:hypothetical protein